MADILLYNNNPPAAPAFRQLIFIKETLDNPVLRSALAKTYARFEAHYGESASIAAYHFDRHKGDFKYMKPELLEAGRAFFDREKSKFGDGMRRYGMLPKEFDNPALPFFSVSSNIGLLLFWKWRCRRSHRPTWRSLMPSLRR
ncbi:hypothetical protein HED63_26255 [Ochrobactrum cytisi]|nr:hypothetical protein [Brucella cytisi]